VATRVQRIGGTVRRPIAFWSPAVHDLLRYLERTGFPAPKLLDSNNRCEVLTWLEGESGPDGWAKIVPEAGLRRWARFLRRYHDAVAGYRPRPGAEWSSGPRACGAGEIICHGDFGPWNTVWQGHEVAGLIDWDMARPAAPIFDVAYALEYAAPFRDDQECIRWLRYPEPPDRRRRIEVFCEAYGMPVPDDVIARVAQQQRMTEATFVALGRRGIEPQATWLSEGHLAEIRARIRWTETAVI